MKPSVSTLIAVALGLGLLVVIGSIVQGGDREPQPRPGGPNDTRLHAPTP